MNKPNYSGLLLGFALGIMVSAILAFSVFVLQDTRPEPTPTEASNILWDASTHGWEYTLTKYFSDPPKPDSLTLFYRGVIVYDGPIPTGPDAPAGPGAGPTGSGQSR